MKNKPRAPKHLTGESKKKWNSIVHEFELKSQLDFDLLAQYCEAYALGQRAADELKHGELIHTAPNGAPYPHPGVNMQIKAIDAMRRISKLLDGKRKQEKNDDDLEL